MRVDRKFVLVAAMVLAGVGVAGCGQDGAEALAGCEVSVAGDVDQKPQVVVPDCDPPAKMQVTDVVEGSGVEAVAGDSVSVQYVGISWSTKEQFDASWDRGAEPFSVAPVGSAAVIDGWNQGLIGAQVGDRRLLVLPPELGYPQGNGPAIGPGETLVFVVDVVAVG